MIRDAPVTPSLGPPASPFRGSCRRRRGFSLAEALVAATILGFALMVGLSVVIWADAIEARATARVAACELASSVCDRVRAAPYASLGSGELDLSGEILADLPEPAVVLEVTEDEDLHLKRVTVVVSWAGKAPGSLKLQTAVGSAEIYRP